MKIRGSLWITGIKRAEIFTEANTLSDCADYIIPPAHTLRDFSSVLLHSKLLKSGLFPATVSLLQSHVDAKWFPHSIILEFQAKYNTKSVGTGH